jgi:hypothetical protein
MSGDTQLRSLCRPMPVTCTLRARGERILTILDDGDVLAVLNRESGKLLEHRQLRKDPHRKTVWDRSYANEVGRLCQGIGTDKAAGGKRVAGTNTFHLITFADIPHHK